MPIEKISISKEIVNKVRQALGEVSETDTGTGDYLENLCAETLHELEEEIKNG